MINGTINSDITILGHLAKDIIEVDGERNESLGGVVYYGGITGCRLGLKISIITLLKKEDFHLLEVFKKNGITYFAYPSKETSGLWNIYSSENLEFRKYKPLGFAGCFKKENIPETNPKFFVIGSILEGEINSKLLNFLALKYKGRIAMDIQGFIRVRRNNKIFYKSLSEKEKTQILSKTDYLKVDQIEAKILTGQDNINDAVLKLQGYGPREILATHEKGITLNDSNKIYFYSWKNKTNLGRTGRGDTAFISYLGSRLSKSPEESLKFSAALTSLKLESSGPFSLTRFEVEQFMQENY